MADKENQVAKKTATDNVAKKPAAPKAPKADKAAPKAAKSAEKSVKKADTADRNRLKKRYTAEIVPALMNEMGYKNVNEVPKLDKIILNMRLGDIKDNAKSITIAQGELEAICGQKCILTKSKKSVANFKLRENQAIGIKVTLRGARMYEFFDKLVSIALPRVRDFRGISAKSFDGRGNFATGVKEQIIFPEIAYETVEKVRGFDICIVTTAKSDNDAKALLVKLGVPFRA